MTATTTTETYTQHFKQAVKALRRDVTWTRSKHKPELDTDTPQPDRNPAIYNFAEVASGDVLGHTRHETDCPQFSAFGRTGSRHGLTQAQARTWIIEQAAIDALTQERARAWAAERDAIAALAA